MIRDLARENKNDKPKQKLEDYYLLTRHEEGDEQFKVLPTQDDRPAFRAIMRQAKSRPPSRLTDAYGFYRRAVMGRDGFLQPEAMELLCTAITEGLSLVSITCDEQDNPHLIFESLNAKGEKLTPADLIRNYLLMRIDTRDQERIFKTRWLPIQQALGEALTEFVRHYVMKEGKSLREADVYFELKDRLNRGSAASAQDFMADLHRHGLLYARFVDPKREPHADIAAGLERLRRLESTVTYPLLLRIFDAQEAGSLTPQQTLRSLDLIESLLIRRSICGSPRGMLNNWLPTVFDRCGGAGPYFEVRLREELGGKRCPDNAAFAAALRTAQLYAPKANARLRVILERLEESYGHKEPASLDAATIEHVMPQTLTPEWEHDLGTEARETWARLLHTLGNLTLSAYNADMSNQPYAAKRAALAQSHLELNRFFQDTPAWTAQSIEARATELARRALTIWPELARGPDADPGVVNRRGKPVAVCFRQRTAPVKSWKHAFVTLIRWFEEERPGLLARLEQSKAMPNVLSIDENLLLRSRACIGGVFVQMDRGPRVLDSSLRRIADTAGIYPADYGYIFPPLPIPRRPAERPLSAPLPCRPFAVNNPPIDS